MRSPTLPLTASATACLLLAGCGSLPELSAGPPNGEAARSAVQIYDDAVAQLRAARSVHVSGSETVRTARGDLHRITFDGVATQDAAHFTFSFDGAHSEDIVVGGKAYHKEGTQGSQWTQLLPSEAVGSEALTLKGFADCTAREHGQISKHGVSTYHGIQVVVIDDDGSAPGAAPTSEYVSLEGPPRFIHMDQNGAETPGGSAACGHVSGLTAVSVTEDFDQYGASVSIQAPPEAAPPSGSVV